MRESLGTKINTALVPYEFICAAAVGLNYGAEKYAPNNYMKGLPITELCMSVERHNRAIMRGEWIDKASGLRHLDLLSSSCAMLVNTLLNGTGIDDTNCGTPQTIEEISAAAQERFILRRALP